MYVKKSSLMAPAALSEGFGSTTLSSELQREECVLVLQAQQAVGADYVSVLKRWQHLISETFSETAKCSLQNLVCVCVKVDKHYEAQGTIVYVIVYVSVREKWQHWISLIIFETAHGKIWCVCVSKFINIMKLRVLSCM